MNKIVLPLILSLIVTGSLFGQVKIGENPTSIDDRSILEIETTDKALYLPRLTTAEQNAQTGWKPGMFVYNTDKETIQYHDSIKWVDLEKVAVQKKNIYSNSIDPNTASVFDDIIPATTHDPSLIQNFDYEYIGSDGTSWKWNGTVYISNNPILSLNVGEEKTILRVMPLSELPGAILPSTGLLEIEGLLRINIVKVSDELYKPTLLNISGGDIAINYQTTSSLVANNLSVSNLTINDNAITEVCLPSAWLEFTVGLVVTYVDNVITNVVLPNGHWYKVEWYAFEKGTDKHIYMSVKRTY